MSAICQICGTTLSTGTVWCAKCATPHHRDCVEFISRCSVFGCGGRLFQEEPPGDGATGFDSVPGASPEPLLSANRHLPGRVLASIGLVARNPLIAGIFLAMSLVPGYLGIRDGLYPLAWVVDVLSVAALVILFTARSRGKELDLVQVLGRLRDVGGRVLLTALIKGFLIRLPFDWMLALPFGGWSNWIPIGGLLFFPWLILNALTGMAMVVAAVDRDEEPDNPLVRSASLSIGVLFQAIFSIGLIRLLHHGYWQVVFHYGLYEDHTLALGIGIQLINLVVSAYWILFYLERRRLVPRESAPTPTS